MKKLFRAAAVAATVAGFAMPGVIASAQTVEVGTTGPESKAKVSLNNVNKFNKANKNNVAGNFKNSQYSTTGSANAKHNTTVGNVTTGNATADNATSVAVAVDNTAGSDCGCGAMGADQDVTVTTEGPKSPAYVNVNNENYTNVRNTNNVTVNNDNKQSAKSGSVNAYGNTTVGDITTGDAAASNETVVDLSIMN